MKKILIIILVLTLLLSTCGCAKVKELEQINGKVEDNIAKLEQEKVELGAEIDKNKYRKQELIDEKACLESELYDVNKYLSQLQSNVVGYKSTGMGFTYIEIHSYFTEIKNKDFPLMKNLYMLDCITETSDSGVISYTYHFYDEEDGDCLVTISYSTTINGTYIGGISVSTNADDNELAVEELNDIRWQCLCSVLNGILQLKTDKGQWDEEQDYLRILLKEGVTPDGKIEMVCWPYEEDGLCFISIRAVKE